MFDGTHFAHAGIAVELPEQRLFHGVPADAVFGEWAAAETGDAARIQRLSFLRSAVRNGDDVGGGRCRPRDVPRSRSRVRALQFSR